MASRRAVLGILGASTVAATGAVAAGATWSAAKDDAPAMGAVPKGLRPGGELDRLVTDEAAKDAFSGSLLVTHRGRTVLARSCGWADKARSVPNGPDTLFGLASVAKLFTAVSVAQLAQHGKLRYDDKLGAHLQGFPADIADQVTIHHLLTHTSGLGDHHGMPGFWETARTWTSETQVFEGIGGFIRKQTLAFPPGAGSGYSNSAYHLLDEIVARASGQPFHDYLRQHVFRATGMAGTDYYTLPQMREDRRIAHSYWRPPGSADRVESLDEQIFVPGAFSTCAEMERFARALSEEKLLNRAYTRLMLSGKTPMPPMSAGPPGGPAGAQAPQPGGPTGAQAPQPGGPTGAQAPQPGAQAGAQAPPPGPAPVAFQGYGPTVTITGDQTWYGHNGGASNGAATELAIYPDSGYVTVILSNYEMESTRPIVRLTRQLITGG
ncbi:serine hydrolase domain-containing protein [Streptodolium elevatio]|uniref:Serine hydrolase domain-containing protein n=1 Tax=Streptodolium elevatio TaxID=3157996 RepID=A0ABV3DIK1_9ACTN